MMFGKSAVPLEAQMELKRKEAENATELQRIRASNEAHVLPTDVPDYGSVLSEEQKAIKAARTTEKRY